MAKIKTAIAFAISQSLINDVLYNGNDESQPASCPLYLKRKYVDNWETPPSDVMLKGKYFEWHLLGATRDGIEPKLPRVGYKKLSPSSTTKKEDMQKWLEERGVFITGDKNALYEKIKEFPVEYDEGQPSEHQNNLDQLISIAKGVIKQMGGDVEKGEKQVKIVVGDKSGHIDWITENFIEPKLKGKCIIDVKYTETRVDDRYNGWGDFQERSDPQVEKAKTQAGQYITLYHAKHGVYLPYYFMIFGKSGWVQIIKMQMLESGLIDIQKKQELTLDIVKKLDAKGWPAKPEYNKCLNCPFAAYNLNGETIICESRSVTPTLIQVQF